MTSPLPRAPPASPRHPRPRGTVGRSPRGVRRAHLPQRRVPVRAQRHRRVHRLAPRRLLSPCFGVNSSSCLARRRRAEAARLRRARRDPDLDLDLDPDVLPTPLDDRAAATAWRLAFRDAVRAEWLWASGRCAQTRNLRRHGARVVRVALHGGRAVTASLDGTVRIHDVKTGSEIRIRDEHDVGDGDGAASAEFGELGQTAADRLADASSATPLRSPATPLRSHPPAPVLCLAASDGVAAAGTSDGFVTAYDVPRGAKMHRTRFGRAPVVSVAVGAGWIVAGLADGSTETRAVADGGVVARGRVARPSPTMCDIVRCVEIHPESRYAAAVAGAEVVAWKLERDDDEDDNHSVCDSGGAACPIARRAGGRSPSTRRLEGHVEPVRCVCFASLRPRADGTSRVAVVTGGDDGTIRAFDPVTGRCLREMEGPPGTTEAEHAGQVPVGWTYRPPPGITCVAAWAGQVVEARDDGSVLVWTNALDDVSDDEGDEDENDENDENGRDDGSVGESSDAARAVAALVRQLSGEGGFRRPRSDPIEGEGEGEGASASASASWSQSRSRSRSRSLARRRRRRPAAYRRWWPHSDAVTGVVARGGRVVSVSEDGGCHVLPLPEDVLARAHAHLAAENRAWAARASAAARSEARTEEHAHESLEASASWARTRAGGSTCSGSTERAPRRALLGVHVRGVPVHEPGVARGERRRGGGGGGVVARGRSAQRRRRLRRRRRHVRRHARRRGSRMDHGRSTGGVRGVRGGFHGGGDGGGCGEIRTRSRESGGGENRRTRRTIRAVARAHFQGTQRRGVVRRRG